MRRRAKNGPSIRIPPREKLVRDGIPAEVIQHFHREARRLRAETFAAAFRHVGRWTLFGQRHNPPLARGSV